MVYVIFILLKPFSVFPCPVDGGNVILEELIPIRGEMFHHSIKVTNQKAFVLIYSDTSFSEHK